jgi:thiol:disulfide interchange protein DsbA
MKPINRREITFALTGGLLWASNAQAQNFQEGIEYVTLDQPMATEAGPGKVELIEFFWYSCPHCNAFEPQFAAWKKAAPKDVVVQRVPVRFRDDFEPQQRAYYVFESLNMVDAMHGKLFHAIHTERQQLNSAQALAAWADKNGLPEKKFIETFNSFGVASKARRATQLQDAFKVQGVPALGIAGRFYTDGSLTQTMDRSLQVAEYLIGEVRRGR